MHAKKCPRGRPTTADLVVVNIKDFLATPLVALAAESTVPRGILNCLSIIF